MIYALKAEDGHVAIMQISEGADIDAEVAKFAEVNWHPVSVTPIDPATIPQDRSYRNAWAVSDKGISHDMGKAREIHKDKLRAERTSLLARLDVEQLKAISSADGTKIGEIEKEKQRLRDITKDARIAAATSIDALKAITV